jgi:hypothetical protein
VPASRALAIVPSRPAAPTHPTSRPLALLRRHRRSAVGFTDHDHRPVFTNQIGQVRRQFVERHIRCLSDMSKRVGELVRTPHVDDKQRGIPPKTPRKRLWRNPRRRLWQSLKPAGQKVHGAIFHGSTFGTQVAFSREQSIKPASVFIGPGNQRRLSNRDPLNLIERDLVTGPIVQLCRARAFLRGHGLGVFDRAARLEIGGDAGRPEDVAPELARLGRAPSDHLVGIDAMHRPVGQDSCSARCRAEEGGLVVIADTGHGEIFIEEVLELVVRRHLS